MRKHPGAWPSLSEQCRRCDFKSHRRHCRIGDDDDERQTDSHESAETTGTTRTAQAKGAMANRAKAKASYAQVKNYARMLRDQGDSFATIAKRLNEDGYRTRNGKAFAPMTVHRMLKRNHD